MAIMGVCLTSLYTLFQLAEILPAEDEDTSSVVWHDAEDDGDQEPAVAETLPSAQESNVPNFGAMFGITILMFSNVINC